MKNLNFVKSYIWDMIYIRNLILGTMVFEYFNNSLYFKSYGHFLERYYLPGTICKDFRYHFTNRFWLGIFNTFFYTYCWPKMDFIDIFPLFYCGNTFYSKICFQYFQIIENQDQSHFEKIILGNIGYLRRLSRILTLPKFICWFFLLILILCQ